MAGPKHAIEPNSHLPVYRTEITVGWGTRDYKTVVRSLDEALTATFESFSDIYPVGERLDIHVTWVHAQVLSHVDD